MRRRRLKARGQSFRLSPARIVAALVVGGVGLWVGASSFGSTVRKTSLDLAASLTPTSASVLTLRSRAALEAGKLREASRLATLAIKRDPTAVGAVTTLGIAAQASGDAELARKLLARAESLSRRDLQTHLWGIEVAVARNDIPKALQHYDYALRTSVRSREILFPVLANTIDDAEIRPRLLARLAERPLWLEPFVTFVAEEGRVAPATATSFLSSVRAAGLEVPAHSLVMLVGRSVDAGQAPAAWNAYRLYRPRADRRQVRDPSFADLPSTPTRFDWDFGSEGGIIAETNADNGGVPVLNVAVAAGVGGRVAQQLQFLPAGSYRLSLAFGPSSLRGGRLTFTLTCDSGLELARLALSQDRAGTATSPPFRISASCPTQWLRIDALPTDSIDGIQAAIRRVALL